MNIPAGSLVELNPAIDHRWDRGIVLSSTERTLRVAPYSLDGTMPLIGIGLPSIRDVSVSRSKVLLPPPLQPIMEETEDA